MHVRMSTYAIICLCTYVCTYVCTCTEVVTLFCDVVCREILLESAELDPQQLKGEGCLLACVFVRMYVCMHVPLCVCLWLLLRIQ